MANTSPLKLMLPERVPAQESSFFLDEKEVESWILTLPLANTGETSKRTFKTLVEFNRLEIPNVTRVKIANMLRPVVRHIVTSLDKYYLGVSIPLTAKNQKIVVLCRELHMELANSYKIIIESMAAGQEEKFDQKIMIVALHQALHHLFKVLYFSVIAYNPYPGNIWKEIHQLFHFAVQNNVADININSGSDNPGTVSSIKRIYQSIQLLALASPYGLRQKEMECLLARLSGLSEQIHIAPMSTETEQDGQFFIHAESDKPPAHISLREDEPSTLCYILDTSKVVQQLRTNLKALYSDNDSGSIFTQEMQVTAPMFRKVIKSLTYEPKRGFIRTNLNFKLNTVVGISDIHSKITANRATSTETESKTREGTTEKQHEPGKSSFLDNYFSADGADLEIVPLDYPGPGSFTYQQQPDPTIEDDGTPAWIKQPQNDKSELFSCTTQNESAGGYCINWNGEKAPNIIVGELVGIQSASNPSQFSVGIVRWLKHMPEVGLQLGFEIASPITEAVTVHIKTTHKHKSPAQKSILLPSNSSANKPATLIMPTVNIHVGDEIFIELAGKRRPAKLIRLLESTGTFSQYEFAYLDEDDS